MRLNLIRLLPVTIMCLACRPNSVTARDASLSPAIEPDVDAGTSGPNGPTGATGGWFVNCAPDAGIPCESCRFGTIAHVLSGPSAFDCGTALGGGPEAQAVRDCAARKYLDGRPFIATVEQPSTDTDQTEVLVGRSDGGLSLLKDFGVGAPSFTLIEADCPQAAVLDGGGGYLALICQERTFCSHCGPCP